MSKLTKMLNGRPEGPDRPIPANQYTADEAHQGSRQQAEAKPVRVPKPANSNQRQLLLVSSSAVLEEGGPPLAGVYTVIAVLLMIFGAIAWAASTDVSTSTLAPGAVQPTGHIVQVQHYEGGIVASVPVREGDVVEAGTVLMVLEPNTSGADLQQMLARHGFLSIATERLRAEAFGHEPDFDAWIPDYPDLVMNQIDILEAGRAALEGEQAILRSRIDQRQTDIEIYQNQVDNLLQQRAVVGEQLRMRQTLLERGLASRLTVLDVQREYTQVEGDLALARTNLARAEQAVEEAKHSVAELELRYRSDSIDELGTAAGELAQINESLVSLQDQALRREVIAPTRGIVNQLSATLPGQVIEPGQPVASLVPSDGGLMVEARLKPADVGYVQIGQRADLSVEGFDVAQFGVLPGVVTYIAPTTVTLEDGSSYYRIRIEPEAQQIGHAGNLHELIPGMVVQSTIHTGSQSMLAYLVRPVYRSLSQAFSER